MSEKELYPYQERGSGDVVSEMPASYGMPAYGHLGKTPPIGLLPPRGTRTWVETTNALHSAVTKLRNAHVIAVDAEFAQIRPRAQQDIPSSVPRLALLQLAVEEQCFVIDALRLYDLTPLMHVFGHPETVVLLHGAGADLRVMASRGLQVARYYDLEAASRSIFGQHESSLAAMLLRAFGIRLDKSLQRTDWTRRPLPQAMIAYAARDAEVTLALYAWLKQYYSDILDLHYYTDEPEQAAAWIEPFLYSGYANMAAAQDAAPADARDVSADKEQLCEDCRAALQAVIHPLYRSRLLRLIADLSLVELVPDIEASLHAPTSDERAAAMRALARLSDPAARAAGDLLVRDPVEEVRKAAGIALRNLEEKEREPRQPHLPTTRASDGTRSWLIGTSEQAADDDPPDANDWRARLRAMMDQDQ